MPNLDGTGPRGNGSMTGRGLGRCGRGYGRGRGLGRCYWSNQVMSKEEEKKLLEQELKDINKRLKELKD